MRSATATCRCSGSGEFSNASCAFFLSPAPSSFTTFQSRWSPLAVVPRDGRTRTLSPLRIGLPGSSTLSGRCRSKFKPNERRDERALNSCSSSCPSVGSLAFACAIKSVSRDTPTSFHFYATNRILGIPSSLTGFVRRKARCSSPCRVDQPIKHFPITVHPCLVYDANLRRLAPSACHRIQPSKNWRQHVRMASASSLSSGSAWPLVVSLNSETRVSGRGSFVTTILERRFQAGAVSREVGADGPASVRRTSGDQGHDDAPDPRARSADDGVGQRPVRKLFILVIFAASFGERATRVILTFWSLGRPTNSASQRWPLIPNVSAKLPSLLARLLIATW